MAQDFIQIMARSFMGLLVSLTLSSGMILDQKGMPTPPPSGSVVYPTPPKDSLNSSVGSGSMGNSHLPSSNPMPQNRGSYQMPFPDYQMPPPAASQNKLTPLNFSASQGSRMLGAEIPDLAYCNMILEAPIPPTADQVPWFCTCSLCNGGGTGPKGDRGDRGLPGRPGSPGRRGLTGLPGPPGFTGHQGIKGQKGNDGLKGDQGAIGPMGRKGEYGEKGDKGDMGEDGRPGAQGPPGEPGQCPASCDVTSGPPGEIGLPGTVGPRGLPGISGSPGMKGQKGDMGEMGEPGKPGAIGQKGDQGEQGLCHCQDGEKGDTGLQGPSGPRGEKGDAGHQGTSGVDGAKGEKGDEGMKGPPGPCTPAIQSAFSARLGDNYPQPNLPVPFSIVIYNMQFHYDPSSGVYIAPVNGTYVFSYHLVVYSKVLKVGLFHNFVPIVKSTELVNLGTVSQQVVLHLSMGDMVWLQVKDTNTNGMYANSESSSTFSGFLLYPDSCDFPLLRDMPIPNMPHRTEYNWGELGGPATLAP